MEEPIRTPQTPTPQGSAPQGSAPQGSAPETDGRGGVGTDPSASRAASSVEADQRVRSTTGITPERSFDHAKIERAVRMLIEAIGEDPDRAGIVDTPARVARSFDEIFAGLLVDPADVLSVSFDESYDEIVMMRDIEFHSMCEHHFVPFAGRAHVAYLPNREGRITGLSKLARLVDICAKRPGLQERMTTMIADALERALQPRGVMVVVEARHLCMEMRGIRKPGAETVTSTVRGIFRDDPKTRSEALTLLSR